MMTYNTQLKKLILPEYGRNIQRMIDHCMTISDRNLRTDCAYSIVDVMYKMFPPTGNANEYRRKLWDHLAIMSDFELDIDWPEEVIKPESLSTHPDPLPLPIDEIVNHQYGKYIEIMAWQISQMPPSEERDVLTLLIANHMKKVLSGTANDAVEDDRVFRDLADMTQGVIRLKSGEVRLHEFKTLPLPKKKKKK